VAVERYDSDLHLNVGTGKDLSIKELADLVAKKAGFGGEIEWDASKPDGTPRKVLDITRLQALEWEPRVSLESGIAETIQWFESNYN
jgi:GDP-L-fucose synthase